jgi:hypothetical protein
MDAIPAFLKNHYGTTIDANWFIIFKTVYEETPTWICGQEDSLKFFPWHSEQDIKDMLGRNEQKPNHFTKIVNLLSAYKDSVKMNMGDFNDFMLTIEFMEYTYNRQHDMQVVVNSKSIDLRSVETYLKKTALADQHQLSKITAAWSNGRRCKPDGIDDNYLWSFYKAANYSKHLSEHPAEFLKILGK